MILSFVRLYLLSCSLLEIKFQIKRLNIKKFSSLNKQELVNSILKYYFALLVQKQYRKHIALNSVCSISLDNIKYPFWAKKTEKGFIYYNLDSLATYLITGGSFKDPTTREIYTDEELVSIDKTIHSNNLSKTFKSVLRSRYNTKYYRAIRDNDEQIDILSERIRHITWSIRDKIEIISSFENSSENSPENSPENSSNRYCEKSFDISSETSKFTNLLYNRYFPAISDYLVILNKKCSKSRELCFYNMNLVIENIKTPSEDSLIFRLKSMVLRYINLESYKFL